MPLAQGTEALSQVAIGVLLQPLPQSVSNDSGTVIRGHALVDGDVQPSAAQKTLGAVGLEATGLTVTNSRREGAGGKSLMRASPRTTQRVFWSRSNTTKFRTTSSNASGESRPWRRTACGVGV